MWLPTTTLIISVCSTIKVAFITVPTSFKIDTHSFAHLPRRLNTCTQSHSITISWHRTANTSTSKRNKIPNTILIVTAKEVAQIEHYLLLRNPILVAVIKLRSRITVSTDTLAPDTLYLCTKTDTRCKPLTNSESCTRLWTEVLQRTDCCITPMLLVRIPCVPVCTKLYEPVAPKRVGSNAILLSENFILGKTGHRHTSQCQNYQ